MKLDDLTIGEARQLVQMFGAATASRSTAAPTGRAVVVVDRGWIFAGDRSITAEGKLRLENAVWVFNWQTIGFAKMLENWRSDKVDLRRIASPEIPLDAEIFSVPVAPDWGLK